MTLSADLTMGGGRVVHVPSVPEPPPASGGKVKVAIPFPAEAKGGVVYGAVVTNDETGTEMRCAFARLTWLEPGDALTVVFGDDSMAFEDFAALVEGGPDERA